MVKLESAILKNWKAKIALIAAVVVPSVTATGAFYKTKEDVVSRISAVELRTEQNFADKTTMNRMQDNIQHLRDDLGDVKSDLKLLLRERHNGR